MSDSPPPAILRSGLLDGRVAVLTLNRPQRKNALGPDDWQALADQLDVLERDPGLRVVVLRGAGGAFCAGGDLRTMPARIDCPPAQREQQLRRDSQVIRRLYELPQPVIAEIDGPCLGAGLALALCCDLRLCASSASFGAVFHRVGLSADFGLSWLLPQAVGAGRAMELLLTADVISAQRAGELGLVQRVLPAGELGAATLALCAQLASGPPLAQAVTKRALHRATSATLASTLDSEAQSQTLLGKTSDAHEGIAAFLERRQPHFTGQ